jgi:hypothetical protein
MQKQQIASAGHFSAPKTLLDKEAAKPAHPGHTPPDPRKLRRDLIMALIETCPTRVAKERADILISDAEKLASYITNGAVAGEVA